MAKIIIDNIVYSIQKIGGISLVFFEQTKRLLKDSRYQIEFIECEDANENYYRKLLNISEDVISIFSRKWLYLLRYINPKPGITKSYIFHSSYYRTSRDKMAINVTTVHDFTYKRISNKTLASYVHIWQQRRAIFNSDIIICISENTKKDLLYYYNGINESKVHVVYNGVSDEYRKLDELDEDYLPFNNGTYCIYVGVRQKYKNYDLVVDVIAKTNYNLLLIGPSLTEKERLYLDAKIGRNKYVCMSRVSNEKLNILYNGAFCLFYLSSYEGFGIPCIEAQKAGCPIIAYNASSIPEVVCDIDLLCNNLNVDDVYSKLLKLEDISYRNKVIDKGIDFAEQFSWNRCYKELTDIYEKAIYNAKK